jgi:hypothetical protein
VERPFFMRYFCLLHGLLFFCLLFPLSCLSISFSSPHLSPFVSPLTGLLVIIIRVLFPLILSSPLPLIHRAPPSPALKTYPLCTLCIFYTRPSLDLSTPPLFDPTSRTILGLGWGCSQKWPFWGLFRGSGVGSGWGCKMVQVTQLVQVSLSLLLLSAILSLFAAGHNGSPAGARSLVVTCSLAAPPPMHTRPVSQTQPMFRPRPPA